MTVSVLVLQIRKPVKYHQRAFSFQISHYIRNRHLGRYADQHVDVIGASFCFNDFYSLLLARLPKDSSYLSAQLSVYYLSAVQSILRKGAISAKARATLLVAMENPQQ